jgi:predicted TIM-barrel fold metal-dependent hydrolase
MCGTVSAWLGAIKSVGAERIISGSDWPFGSIEIQMKNKWDLTKISEKDRRLILGENIARLLHIE